MRPTKEDLSNYWDMANEWIQMRGVPRVLLLGVTPELYGLPWPKGTDFLAVDSSQAMIDAVWPGPRKAARCANWLSLDLPKNSRDIILCDGGLHLLKYPQGQKKLIRALHRLLSADGICIFRLFVLPSKKESPGEIIHDLLSGKIDDPSALKLRLSMSLQNSAEEGIELGRVHRTLMRAVSSLEELAEKTGWPVESTLTINNYGDMRYKYYLPELEQAAAMFRIEPGGFQVHRLRTPSYKLGPCCPTIALRRC